ncbi:MAG: isoleucine--tRNA ligase [Bacteroidetes bacterium]|nr:isoleucine--tRNA ligase [Bacteroidota bacterium]
MPTNTASYPEPGSLNLVSIDQEVGAFWERAGIFQRSLDERRNAQPFVFYEGPPSANGRPGIHHVMSRTIKDLFCRYQTQKGRRVERKGGWDTHGLPIEIAVEKTLGITKEDIGQKISVEEYNAACRKEVLRYKDTWDDLTRRMGYWVDLQHPYITFDADYIDSLWHLLRTMYDKGLLYKGYTIQPFSPAAGTGLSTHELNQPGSYRMVKDTTLTAQFRRAGTDDEFFLAWTTTPWTLPSNTALAVGADIAYELIQTDNPYTQLPVKVWIAAALRNRYFKEEEEGQAWSVVSRAFGRELARMRYEQLLPYAQPDNGDAFVVVSADFVSTEDGTGIVHIAPSFGSDDMRTAQQNGLGSLTLVDRQGRFTQQVGEFSGRYVKNYSDDPAYVSVDVDIAVKLKQENRAFRIEKYEHSYPHCWRTDKPVIYYPLDSWFIRTTAVKERMLELNRTINWKPAATGEGRFGQWLENLVDWNLSRSRFWGTPLPIWRTADAAEEVCIGSLAELREAVERSVAAGFMEAPLPPDFDPHRPFVDRITLVSPSGKPMQREEDLIDVWFDSGAMPYAQWHYPVENQERFAASFPADFIAEGVDQTRGWFFTLHAIATIISDGVAYRNVVSNGLLLDKDGNKMSKRLGNAVDPFDILNEYGADATRWYIITNSQPWDNLRFDAEGIDKLRRKFFGTLHNTYSFYALYANVDGFRGQQQEVPLAERPEIDRWIISLLNSLVRETDELYAAYEPTRAGRLIQTFVTDHLSNWYVRLCRRRFWKGEFNEDKVAAYQTLRECLSTVAKLMAPIAPYYADYLYRSLRLGEGADAEISVHLEYFPFWNSSVVDQALEERMQMAQDLSSLVLSLRKQENIRVRQPLQRILVPVLDDTMQEQLEAVRDLVLSEVNVKEMTFVRDNEEGAFTKKIKPDFKALGPRMGKRMKTVALAVNAMNQEDIRQLERTGSLALMLEDGPATLERSDVDISTEDMPGWQVASEGGLTVALDITLSDALRTEGDAREFVNRMQRLRKDMNLDVTDRIRVQLERSGDISDSIMQHSDYICSEILAEEISLTDAVENHSAQLLTISDIPVRVFVLKL